MKPVLLAACVLFFTCAQSQNNRPKLEAYVAPGFFFERLSNDDLIPPDRQNQNRLGDVTSYTLQLAMPLKNNRWTVKAGAGFSQRHYSLNKYDIGDFFTSIFLFDSPLRSDSFNLSYVRFTNNYFQAPISFSYTLTRPSHNFQLAVGLNIRPDFLTNSKAEIRFDSAYKTPTQSDIVYAKNIYTSHASKFVFTAESYIESSFSVYKNVGLLFQFRPFSFYSSDLDKRLTTSTVELFSFTFGAFYSLK